MRADRLLSIMLLLQVHRRMTARELAERLEVSERTIHRDMDALSGSGVPVHAERGPGGGWVLEESFQTNLTGLNEAETQALFLSTGSPSLLSDLGLQGASQAAVIKLLAALPSISRRDAEYTRQRIHVDGAGWRASDERVPLLPRVQEAIWQERKLHITYHAGHRSLECLVDPLGLVAKASTWYLIGAIGGDIRSYRVSRIQEARVTDQACVRPKSFDLAQYWESVAADFMTRLLWYPVRLRAQSYTVERMRHSSRFARFGEVGLPGADGWVELSVQFETERDACEFVLGFGPEVQIVEPHELRARVIALAHETVDRHADYNLLPPFSF